MREADAKRVDGAGAAGAGALRAGVIDLVPIGVGHGAFYAALYMDPDVMHHVGPPLTAAAASRAFTRVLAQTGAAPPRAHYWIARDATGVPCGLVALVRDRDAPASAELGMMLLPRVRGQGHGLASIRCIARHAFAELDVQRLWTRHHRDNTAATRLMVASRFRREPVTAGGPRRSWVLTRGDDAGSEPAASLLQSPGAPARLPAGPTATSMSQHGSLACVGTGMMLGAHLGPRARASIEQADVVFAAVSDPLVELWLQQMNPDVRSLQPLYREGKPRQQTYREMVAAMLGEVRAGRRVCGAFYGHPGVFAQVPHRAIAQARAEGFPAHMEPGVSAEDCLYADLGFDPGAFGCQHFETSQFMFYRRRIDPSAYLVLWQVALAGDRSIRRFATGPEHRRLLVERLVEDYPPDHGITLYEAATLPISTPRMEGMPLSQLVDAELSLQTTLVIPPAVPLQRDEAMLARIAQLDLAGPRGQATTAS